MRKEAMKRVLETLERMNHADSIFAGEFDGEVADLREALAEQPAQYSDIVSDGGMDPRNQFDKPAQDSGVVTAGGFDPRTQRTWVGLTNSELQPIADEYRILFGSWVEDFARAIEAKLRSKNEDRN